MANPRRRPVYSNVRPLNINVPTPVDHFLSTIATEWGLSKAELARRILLEAVFAWKERGLYNPPPMAELRARRKDQDRKSTRLNSSHVAISYAVFCLKKKKK